MIVALWPLVVTAAADRRGLARGTGALACVTLAAVVAAGVLGARPSAAALDWQNWNLFGESGTKRTVSLVWSSNYGGIDFPAEKTTVLRITAPHRALYWRATTLDLFTSNRWVETLYTTGVSGGNRALPPDALLPPGATARNRWVRQEVDVRAVVDDHVVAASQPMRLAAGAGQRVQYATSGVMRAHSGLADMRLYTVWSYVSRPTPAQLVRSPPSYPAVLTRELEFGRATMPPFGTPGRTALVSSIFRDERYRAEWPYAALWRQARRVTAGAQSPYQATVRIERWLRSDGGFGYDEHPPAPRGLPPLVDFVQRTKLGYCQQFAGSMALMLRSLGIPARVAVGFTSGVWRNGTWTVTDHDAHAWVEAWFAGYGWLTFDPTPGRGALTATYTNASDSADAIRALGTGRFLGSGSTARCEARRRGAQLEEPRADETSRLAVSRARRGPPRRAARTGCAEARTARHPRLVGRPPGARRRGTGRPGRLRPRPGIAAPADRHDRRARDRAEAIRRRRRRLCSRVQPRALRPARRRGGGGRRGAARASPPARTAARPPRAREARAWLPHGTLAPQRLTGP